MRWERQALFIFEARKNKMCLTVRLAFQSLCTTTSIRNVGLLKSTYVSVYYLAKYKYFAFIFSLKRQILYLADFVNMDRPFGLAVMPYVFYTLLCSVKYSFRYFISCFYFSKLCLRSVDSF